MKQLSFGAEGSIYLTPQNTILKIREPQQFRIEELDLKLRKKRTKREVKVLKHLFENNIKVPQVLNVDLDTTQFEMEYILGDKLHDVLTIKNLQKAIIEIAKMHIQGVVHGDLTPLNMIVNKNDEVILIDFGLADFSTDKENRAVDLNVFCNLLECDYIISKDIKEELLQLYKEQFENKLEVEDVLIRLKEVELRGRNKNK